MEEVSIVQKKKKIPIKEEYYTNRYSYEASLSKSEPHKDSLSYSDLEDLGIGRK